MKKRSRNETNIRRTKSKDGTFSPHIKPELAKRITRFCELTNQNKTRFTEAVIAIGLDIKERELLETSSKDDLIDYAFRYLRGQINE